MVSNAECYEQIVRSLLLSRLVAGQAAAQMNAFHLKRYTGKSGQEHEIDVSFEIDFGGVKLLVLVECKDYGRKVGVDDLMTFVYRLRDIGAHKGLLVTTRGFQAGAVTVARAEGVGLLLAARGILEVYLGAQYTLYEHWISNIELHLSANVPSISVVGKRYVQGNSHSRVVSLHAPRADLESGTSALAFLTHEEESQLESGSHQSVKALLRTYGRAIPSRKEANPVVVC